jgi:hypothetical protein
MEGIDDIHGCNPHPNIRKVRELDNAKGIITLITNDCL